MKLKHLFLLFILLACSFFPQQSYSQNGEPTSEFLLQLATNELPKHLDMIRSDNITYYGFRSEEDIKNIKLSEPIQTCYLSPDFYSDTALKNKDYLVYANEYRIPLVVNDTIRSFLIIAKMDTEWKIVGVGGNKLAERTDRCIKKYKISKGEKFIMMRDLSLNTDFLSQKRQIKDQQEYYPMNNDFIYDIADKRYQSKELLQLLYNKHNKL